MNIHATHDRTLQSPTAIPDFPASIPHALYPPSRADGVHSSPSLTEPPTPTSGATVCRLNASPNTDGHNAFASTMHRTPSRKRSSSRTDRWIAEQQRTPSENGYTIFVEPQLVKGQKDAEAPEVQGRVLQVAEDVTRAESRVDDAHVTLSPATPTTHRSRNSLFHAASPLRTLFSPHRTSAVAARPNSPASSTSTFRRSKPRHSRGSSLSTVNAIQRNARPGRSEVPETPPKLAASRARAHRAPDDDSEGGFPPPRPSTSSSVTHSGSSTIYTRTSSDAPQKMYFGSVRSHSSTTIFSASPSLWSLPTDASHINDPPESTKVIARESTPMIWKPATANNFSGVSQLLAGPKTRRKRKLIISGIPPDDERRFEGVRKWCESFGELHWISRVPNGDLHVNFRKAEIADTVCRLNARVYIVGVGSVCLSWFVGKRP